MAELDTRYYQGQDQYSDGDENENRLLEAAEAGISLDELSVDAVSWPMIYHLHPVRENICNWYPFRRGARILEIGSGCGAITGALCRLDCEVYSVELSKRRASINFARHRDCENLHIMVGNLNDIPFEAPFDYVLLIGVLEYAGKYTGGPEPYRTFLENIRRYLKADGRLLVAIENRLGMKYFAGAPEDHLGRGMAGLRGYDPAEGVRTFSRSELRLLLEESGYGHSRFYYPYPDYKFPNEIFTDDSLQTMHYGKFAFAMEKTRYTLFPEHEIAALLATEGAGGSIANSFFVEAATRSMRDEERTLYVKQNVERAAEYRIGTRITEDGTGNRFVYKYALSDTARAHLQRILKNEAVLGAHRHVLRGEWSGAEIRYPFLTSRTVDAELGELLQKGRKDDALRLIEDVLALASIEAEETEYVSEAFSAWFGDRRLSEDAVPCANPANIDLIMDNIFIEADGYRMVDCEWVTEFPVPVAFILWRALNNAYFQYPRLSEVARKEEMFERCGIHAGDVEIYQAWADHFEAEYVKNKSLARFGKGVFVMKNDFTDFEKYERMIEQLKQQLEHQREVEAMDKAHIKNLEAMFETRAWKLATRLQNLAGLLHRGR